MSIQDRDPNKAKRPHAPDDEEALGQTSARPETEDQIGEEGAMPSTENGQGGGGEPG